MHGALLLHANMIARNHRFVVFIAGGHSQGFEEDEDEDEESIDQIYMRENHMGDTRLHVTEPQQQSLRGLRNESQCCPGIHPGSSGAVLDRLCLRMLSEHKNAGSFTSSIALFPDCKAPTAAS